MIGSCQTISVSLGYGQIWLQWGRGAAIHLIQYCFINNWPTLLYTLVVSDKPFLRTEKRVIKIFYIHVLNIAKFGYMYLIWNMCYICKYLRRNTYEQLPLEQHKKIEKKRFFFLIRRAFLFIKLKNILLMLIVLFMFAKWWKFTKKKTLWLHH